MRIAVSTILEMIIRGNMMIKLSLAVAVVLALGIGGWWFMFGEQSTVTITLKQPASRLSDDDAIRYSRAVLERKGFWVDGMEVDSNAYSDGLVGRNIGDPSRYIVPWLLVKKDGEKSGYSVYLSLNHDHIVGKAVSWK